MNPSPSKEAQRRGGQSSAAQQRRDAQGQFAGKKTDAERKGSQGHEATAGGQSGQQSNLSPDADEDIRGRDIDTTR